MIVRSWKDRRSLTSSHDDKETFFFGFISVSGRLLSLSIASLSSVDPYEGWLFRNKTSHLMTSQAKRLSWMHLMAQPAGINTDLGVCVTVAVGVELANCGLERHRAVLIYFELLIRQLGLRAGEAIGSATASFPPPGAAWTLTWYRVHLRKCACSLETRGLMSCGKGLTLCSTDPCRSHSAGYNIRWSA